MMGATTTERERRDERRAALMAIENIGRMNGLLSGLEKLAQDADTTAEVYLEALLADEFGGEHEQLVKDVRKFTGAIYKACRDTQIQNGAHALERRLGEAVYELGKLP